MRDKMEFAFFRVDDVDGEVEHVFGHFLTRKPNAVENVF